MAVRVRGMEGWLRIACAVLLLSLGFGHKPLQSAPTSWAAAAYALSEGADYGQICLGGEEGSIPGSSGWHGCDTCLVVGGAILPPPPIDHVAAPTAFSAVSFPPRTRIETSLSPRPGAPVRGPPILSA